MQRNALFPRGGFASRHYDAKINSGFLLVRRWPAPFARGSPFWRSVAISCDDAGIFLLAENEKNGVGPPCPLYPWFFPAAVNGAGTVRARSRLRPQRGRVSAITCNHRARLFCFPFLPPTLSRRPHCYGVPLAPFRPSSIVLVLFSRVPPAFIAASFPAFAAAGLSRNRD